MFKQIEHFLFFLSLVVFQNSVAQFFDIKVFDDSVRVVMAASGVLGAAGSIKIKRS